MKLRSILVFVLLLPLLLTSCHSSQELAYISDAQRDSAQSILTTYNTTIHPGDQLYIYVYSQTPEVAVPFNQETHGYVVELSHASSRDTVRNKHLLKISETSKQRNSYQVSGYYVDQQGTIIFPVLGKMVAAGLTQDSLSHKIQQMLISGGYIKDPIVTVTPMNFRVSVVGEVKKPQELHITGDRLTILEAIAMCGDITMDGQRENITVMRDINGVATPIEVDLTQKSLFDSQVYYLQTNDVVYVEPNELKKRKSYRDESWPKRAEFWVAVTAAVVNIVRANVKRFEN